MLFSHSPQLLDQFRQLSVATLSVTGVTAVPDVADTTGPFLERAESRLAQRPESEFPEIAAWRRAFSQMGLKPTQYRCASEALLRRFRKDGSLPSIHPLVDVCNTVSLAYAIPIAVFDLDQVTGNLTVRHATGTEIYATFAGDTETPEAGEVIFADDAGHACSPLDEPAERPFSDPPGNTGCAYRQRGHARHRPARCQRSSRGAPRSPHPWSTVPT
jgi:DNA/RNA-binding domain of Phe-tRNA-synthetase-like protein